LAVSTSTRRPRRSSKKTSRAHVTIERREPLELDYEIHIAVRTSLIAGYRAEQRQRPHVESAGDFLPVG